MRNTFILLLLYCLTSCVNSQPPTNTINKNAEAEAIRQVMRAQEQAWSRGDLDAFMQGYWNSDSLAFIGKKGLTYGWHQTLDNYRKSYPNPAAMGKLTFTLLQVKVMSSDNAYVVGKWHLTREAGDLEGHFSLLWQKINQRWVIVSDHTS